MATDISGTSFSETDASNNSATPNGWPEGQAPSTVNDCARMMMGAIKRAYDRDHAGSWATVGGTANAITLTYTTGPGSYVQGEKFAFKATATNTGATTVNVSGLGAKNVYRKTGAGVAACVGGEIQNGDLIEIEYDGTQFQMMSGNYPRAILSFACAGVAASVTNFFNTFNVSSIEADVLVPCPVAGTIRNMYAQANKAPGAGQTYTLTLRKASVDTALTGVISGGAASAVSDLTHSVAVVAGDNLDVKVITSASAAATVNFTVMFEIDIS